ncbi:MAG: sulfatase [Gemmatimonadota bacterium]|nr:sulfatase [Gemmatimonadota bacterium]MDP6802236.1 sulfatase [Gemmatimonadota bacterium]MDP7032157.1 sulfatase [Gemmatimonadota bacterium]
MTRHRLILHGVLQGILFGVVAGVLDAVFSRNEFLDRRLLTVAVLDWVACLALLGAVLGILAALLVHSGHSARRFRSSRVLAASTSAVLAVFPAWFLVLVQLNVVYLGSDTGALSLGVDAGVTVLAIAAGLFLVRGLTHSFASRGILARILASAPGSLLLAGSFLCVAALSWQGGPSATGPPSGSAPGDAPDVVLVLVDTLRRDHLSAEGYARTTSPSLDALAAEGARFPRFTSPSCYTKPAVASLLTSRYPSGHRVGHLRSVLPERLPTLVEAFRDAGYRTAMFCSNPIISAEFGFSQGAEVFHALEKEFTSKTRLGYALFRLAEGGRNLPGVRLWSGLLLGMEKRVLRGPGAEATSLSAPDVTEAFLDWRRSLSGAPSFAYLHYMEPHAPYRVPEGEAPDFAGDGPAPVAEHPSTVGLFLPFSRAQSVPDETREGMILAYDAEIAYLDRVLGGLFDTLRTHPASGRGTLLAVTSDHGEEFHEHGGWGHGQSLYEELLAVPLVLAGPGVPEGVVVDQAAGLLDVGPTLLDLAGLETPAGMSGRSLRSVLEAASSGNVPEPSSEDEVFAEILYGKNYRARSLRRGEWKVIVSRLDDREEVRLYHLMTDPGELRDLAGEQPDRLAELRDRLRARVDLAREGGAPEASAQFDPVTEERLRALGYLK